MSSKWPPVIRNERLLSRRNICITLVMLAAFGLSFYTGRWSSTVPARTVVRDTANSYDYINPILLCNAHPYQAVAEDSTISHLINAYVSSAQEKDMGVYYQALGSYGWAGINIEEEFAPASMLKVPTMMAVLRYAEDHPEVLHKEIEYDGSFDDNAAEYYKPSHAIIAGRSYTVDKLLTYMITYSDNNAAKLLDTKVIDASEQSHLYIDLGISLALPTNLGDFMSPETYALFLRVLYNGTYLDHEMSEKALNLLTKSNFPTGIRAGVPESIDIAQKFGERQLMKSDGTLIERELHNCGIVYYPKKPYVLCVMTRGHTYEQLATEIAGISKAVYDAKQKRGD